jgi:hypothetical protein
MSAGKAKGMAIHLLQKSGNLKKGSTEATAKGLKRGDMSPAERAKDRASKYSKKKHRASEYKYNPKNNLATLK